MSLSRWRVIIAALVFVLSLVYVLPSIPWVQQSSLATFLPDSRINLGLDLKGGIHLTLEVEVEKALTNSLAQTGQDVRATAQNSGIAVLRPRMFDATTLEFILLKAAEQEKFETLLKDRYSHVSVVSATATENGQLLYKVRFTEAYALRIQDMAQEQALRTIRNRIDQFGVAEPDIRKQADYRIQIQLPGISDPRRAVQLIGQTAHLEFHIVREDVDPYAAVLPPDVVALPMLDRNDPTAQKSGDKPAMIVLEKDAVLTGEDVVDARPSFDQMNEAYVGMDFNSRGAKIFERVTAENVGKRMAIVLDKKVYSAPNINERIAGGRASITGNFSAAAAQDLALVLRAGSLPAPVVILEERTVGPSLGQESIDSGILAAAVGAFAVVIFMAIYYGASGFIANGMLIFTITMLLAGMAAFGATLTLPGIAGIVLTIGMAVDANVLIFERIREELRRGLTPLAAVKAGFERASLSIVDSNLTTIIATIVLYQFGTGPVRGFAVTLSLGIVASMFTAVFVSRGIFEVWAKARGSKGISI